MKSPYNNLLLAAWSVVFTGFSLTTALGFFLFQLTSQKETKKNPLPSVTSIPESNFSSANLYKALCGLDLKPCKVNFAQGKLILNDNNYIKRSQFNSLVKSTECRRKGLNFPFIFICTRNQLDRDFTISYSESSGLRKSIQITFRPKYLSRRREWKNFQRDLQEWIGSSEALY